MKRHPHAEPTSADPFQQRATSALLASLLDATTDKVPIVDQYSSQYGWIDCVNRAYYQHFKPAGHRSWRKLYLMSVIFGLVINAWGFYCEQLYTSMAADIQQGLPGTAAPHNVDLFTFIKELSCNIATL